MDNELQLATIDQLVEELAKRYSTLIVFAHGDVDDINPTFSLVRGSQFTCYGALAQMLYESRQRMKSGAINGDDLDD